MPQSNLATAPEPARPASAPAIEDWPPGRWPLHVPQLEDETMLGWFRRASYRYGMSPHRFANELAARRIPYRWNVETWIAHTRLARDRLGFTAPRPDDRPVAGPAGQVALQPSTGRFCPLCLREDGLWRQRWQQPCTLVCIRHRVALREHCPDCGGVAWRNKAWGRSCLPLHRCAQRLPRALETATPARWCGADLTDHPVPVTQAALDAQAFASQHFNAPATPHGIQVVFGGLPVGARQAAGLLWNLYELADLVAPGDPVATLTDAVDAYTALRDGRASAAIERLTRGHHFQRFFLGQRPKHPVDVNAILLTRYANEHRTTMTRRASLAWRATRLNLAPPPSHDAKLRLAIDRLPEHHESLLCIPAEWVPQLLPPTAVEPPWTADAAGRALNALCLLALGRTDTWAQLAIELGLPHRLHRLAAARFRHVHRPEWDAYQRRLETYAAAIERHPPAIDYRDRRRRALDPDVTARTLTAALGRDAPPPLVTTFWAWYTGGAASLPPAGYLPISDPIDIDGSTRIAFTRTVADLPLIRPAQPP